MEDMQSELKTNLEISSEAMKSKINLSCQEKEKGKHSDLSSELIMDAGNISSHINKNIFISDLQESHNALASESMTCDEKINICSKKLPASKILPFPKELVENNTIPVFLKGCGSDYGETISKKVAVNKNINSLVGIDNTICENVSPNQNCTDKRYSDITESDDIRPIQILPIKPIIDSVVNSPAEINSNPLKIVTGNSGVSDADLNSSYKIGDYSKEEVFSLENKTAFKPILTSVNTLASSDTSEVCLDYESGHVSCEMLPIKELITNKQSKSEIDIQNINSSKGCCSAENKDIVNQSDECSNFKISTNINLEKNLTPENDLLLTKCSNASANDGAISEKNSFEKCSPNKIEPSSAHIEKNTEYEKVPIHENSASLIGYNGTSAVPSEINTIFSKSPHVNLSSLSSTDNPKKLSRKNSYHNLLGLEKNSSVISSSESIEACASLSKLSASAILQESQKSKPSSSDIIDHPCSNNSFNENSIEILKPALSNLVASEISSGTNFGKKISIVGDVSRLSSSDISDNSILMDSRNTVSKDKNPNPENYGTSNSCSDLCTIDSLNKVHSNSKVKPPEDSVDQSKLGTELETYCNDNPNSLKTVKSDIKNDSECDFFNEDSSSQSSIENSTVVSEIISNLNMSTICEDRIPLENEGESIIGIGNPNSTEVISLDSNNIVEATVKCSIINASKCNIVNENYLDSNIVHPERCTNSEKSHTHKNLISLTSCKKTVADSLGKYCINELALSSKSTIETRTVDSEIISNLSESSICEGLMPLKNDKCLITDIYKGESINGNQNFTELSSLDANNIVDITTKSSTTNVSECDSINKDSSESNTVYPERCINSEQSSTHKNLIPLKTCKETVTDSPESCCANNLALSSKSTIETRTVDSKIISNLSKSPCKDLMPLKNPKCESINGTNNLNSTEVIGLDAKNITETSAINPEIPYNFENIDKEIPTSLIANKNNILSSGILSSSCLSDSNNKASIIDGTNQKVSLVKNSTHEDKIVLTNSNLELTSSKHSNKLCVQEKPTDLNSMFDPKNETDSTDDGTLSNIKIICVTSLEKNSLKVVASDIENSEETINTAESNVIENLTNEKRVNAILNCEEKDSSEQNNLFDAIKATVLFSDKLIKLPSNEKINLPIANDDQSDNSEIAQIGISNKRKLSDDIGDDIVLIKKSCRPNTESSKHMVVIKQERIEEYNNESSGTAEMNTGNIKEEISEEAPFINSAEVVSSELLDEENNDELNLIVESETISTSIVPNKHKRKKSSPRRSSNHCKKRKKSQSSKSEKRASSSSLQYFVALPDYLSKISELFPSLVVQRERTDENDKVKVTCLLFEDKVLDWAFTDTLLSSVDSSRTISQRHPVGQGGKSTLIFPPEDTPRDIYYCVDLGPHFPFSMPNHSDIDSSEEIIPLPYPLQQLSEFCPNSSGMREMYSKENFSLATIQFHSKPLEFAFNETMLSSFEDSPILSYNLKLTNEWPDLSMDFVGVLELDYSFPFTCPNNRRQFESILFEPLVPEIPVELRDITIDIHEVPVHLGSEMDLERESLLRLLALASYYSYVFRIKEVQSNPRLSMTISSIVASLKPLIISQANSYGMKIEEARRIALEGFYSKDESILPCLLRGPVVGSRKNLFSHSGLVKLEKAVANDKNNVLKRKL